MEQILMNELNAELKRRLERITNKYNIDISLDELFEKYKIKEISILETPEKVIRGPHKIAKNDKRCQARIWGKDIKNRVRWDKDQEEWIYGHQCKRTQQDNELYCGIHLKHLGHGNFFEEVPHSHFDRFKYSNK